MSALDVAILTALHRKINEVLAEEGRQPLMLANIRPLAKRGSLDLKEAATAVALDAEMENIPADKSFGKNTPDVSGKVVERKVGMGSEKSGERERTEKEEKKKVKQSKKMRLKEVKKRRKNLIKARDDPEIDLVQKAKKRLFGDKIERKGEEKMKKIKKKKGKLEKRDKKKGAHACSRCTKEFKFPTLLAEVSLILKVRMIKTASDIFQ